MKKVIIALLVLGACGSVVFAGDMQKEGSVLLGYASPSGDVGDLVDGGVAFGFDYDGYKINDLWSIGGTFMYNSNTGKQTDILGDEYKYDISSWGLTPYAKISKEVELGGTKANVFGLAGLGLYGVTTEVSILGVSAEASDSQFGFNFGGGIMFPMGDKMKIGADVRYHIVASDLSYFIPAAKFTYSF